VRLAGAGRTERQQVSTAVQLRFPLARTTSLPETFRVPLRGLAGRRVNSEGCWLSRQPLPQPGGATVPMLATGWSS